MDESQLLFNLFSNIGVPATICFYTLYGVKNSLDKLTVAINSLKDNHSKEIAALKDEIKALKFRVEHWEVGHNG